MDYPGRLWIARADLGAIYSPDGMTIQFDNETIWQRALEAPPPPLRASAPVNVGRAAIFDHAGVSGHIEPKTHVGVEREAARACKPGKGWP